MGREGGAGYSPAERLELMRPREEGSAPRAARNGQFFRRAPSDRSGWTQDIRHAGRVHLLLSAGQGFQDHCINVAVLMNFNSIVKHST